MSFRRFLLLSFIISTLLPAFSETIKETADTIISLEEVSVSSVKIGNSIMNEPVSGTVMSQKGLKDLDISNLKGMSDIAPNFYMPEYGSRITSSIYVRGLGSRIDAPTISLLYDNIPILNKNNFDFDVWNVNRIEIIRGAQSALYGRNSMTGVMNIFTLSPLNYEGNRARLSYGGYNTWKASIGSYHKTDFGLGVGLSVDYNSTSGYYKNVYNGKNTGRERNWSIRHRATWESKTHWKLDNSFTVNISRQSGYPYESLETRQINYNDTSFYRRLGILEGITVSGPLTSNIGLTSVTSYQYLNDNLTLDQDFLPEEYFTLSQITHESGLTQDIVVKSLKPIGIYDWLGGAFIWGRFGTMKAPVVFKDDGIRNLIEHHANQGNPYYPILWDDRQFLIDTNFKPSSWGLALYHKSSIKHGRWSANLALRFEYEKVMLDYRSQIHTAYTVYHAATSSVYSHANVDIDDNGYLHQSFVELLPQITLSYQYGRQASDNIYINIAKGFKSGGYNTQMFSDVMQQRLRRFLGLSMQYNVEDIVSYEPEKAWNFELGMHSSLFDNRMELSASAFYIYCMNQQLTMFPNGTTTGRIMVNAGKSRSIGLEGSLLWQLDSKWNVSAAFGLADAKFIEFDDGRNSYKGNHIPYAPLTTSFLGLNYTTSLKDKNLWFDSLGFTLSGKGTGPIWWNELNTFKQNWYPLVDLSLRLDKGMVEFELWMKNITATKYSTFYFQSMENNFIQKGRPFNIGLTISLNMR